MLSDFGDSAVLGLGRMKSSVGTRFYRAPECYASGQGHDSSVDIWAVGMLTLQLFLGHEEFPGLDSVIFNSEEEVGNYVDFVFAILSHSRSISAAGKSFVRACLTYKSKERPTARQAFYHDWLQRPRSDRKLFKQIEADNVLSWKPQRVKFPVLEPLTVESACEDSHGQGLDVKRKVLQDTVSPHFMHRVQIPCCASQNLPAANEQAGADVHSSGHDEDRIHVPGSTSPTALGAAAQVPPKRKTLSYGGSAKRPRASSL
ncbi:hypothetical protein VTK56DRAFT_9310 [Thermocarpiscus australiensis]